MPAMIGKNHPGDAVPDHACQLSGNFCIACNNTVTDTITETSTTTLFTMLRFIISTAFFLVITLLSYNYFFGTAEEKEQAQEIFSKGAEAVGASAGFLKSEYQKYQGGKYDEALENVSHLVGKLKEQGGELFGEIESWKQRKNDWDQKKNDLHQLLDANPDTVDKETVRKAIAELEKERKILEIEGKRLQEQAE